MLAVVMVVFIGPFTGASDATSNGRIRPEGRQGPRSPSQRLSRLFSLAATARHSSRETKKPSAAVLRVASGLTAAGRSPPGPRTAIEAAMVAARQQRKTTHG
jgi:hypothetical protein